MVTSHLVTKQTLTPLHLAEKDAENSMRKPCTNQVQAYVDIS